MNIKLSLMNRGWPGMNIGWLGMNSWHRRSVRPVRPANVVRERQFKH
jgi:hypothetical protein